MSQKPGFSFYFFRSLVAIKVGRVMAGMGVIRSSDYESPESANGMERSATQRKAKKKDQNGAKAKWEKRHIENLYFSPRAFAEFSSFQTSVETLLLWIAFYFCFAAFPKKKLFESGFFSSVFSNI